MSAFRRAVRQREKGGRGEVRAALPTVGWLAAAEDDQLQSTLRQLVEWSLVDVTQDHAHQYATADEYERKNLRYSLTKAGEAAVAGVVHTLTQLESTGALQTAVLDAIADPMGSPWPRSRSATSCWPPWRKKCREWGRRRFA